LIELKEFKTENLLFKCGMRGPAAEIVLSDSQNMSDGHQSSTSYFIVTRQLARTSWAV